MIKEIGGHPFRIVFKAGGNELFCEGCMAEYSWAMYDDDPEYFIEIHNRFHPGGK